MKFGSNQSKPEFTVDLKGATIEMASKDKSSKKNVFEVNSTHSSLSMRVLLSSVETNTGKVCDQVICTIVLFGWCVCVCTRVWASCMPTAASWRKFWDGSKLASVLPLFTASDAFRGW